MLVPQSRCRTYVSLALALALCAFGPWGCADESSPKVADDQDAGPDGEDASVTPGATDAAANDAESVQPSVDASEDASGGDPIDASAPEETDASGGTSVDGGCPDAQGCEPTALDPLAPYQLNCRNLPTNAVCPGAGPHEVLLVSQESGAVVMLDPQDGHFVGYFKRPDADYNVSGIGEYTFATQGPDQCIWTVNNSTRTDEEVKGVQRWNPDGTYKDAPLEQHYFKISGSPYDLALNYVRALAFTRDRVYVSTEYGNPQPRVLSYTLDGKFERVVVDDGAQIASMLVLGDGSLLVSDSTTSSLKRYPAGTGGVKTYGIDLAGAGQVSYAGPSTVLVSELTSDGAEYALNLTSEQYEMVFPKFDGSMNSNGIAKLGNGHWLVTGNASAISVDPAATNPSGKAELIAPDSAYNYGDSMQQVGRACLSEQFIQDHAFTAVADGCAAPPSGTAVIDENFETGDFAVGTGGARTFGAFTDRAAAGVTVSIEQGTGAGETRALKILGARMETDARNRVIGTSDSGVFATFAKFEPKYVSFRVKVGVETATALRSPSHARGTFALASEADKGSGNGGHPRLLGTTTINDYLGTLNADASSYPAGLGGKWAHVEMRNFDWTRRRFDYYVDCKRVAQHVDIPAGYGSGADILDLFNYADSAAVATSPHTLAWFDDIIVK
jgi:hypothetical protein